MTEAIENVVCLGCGLVCDDLRVQVAGGSVLEAERACAMGEQWFADVESPPNGSAEIEGRSDTLTAAVERAREILVGSAAPLLWGLAHSTIETQRAAIALADRLGGTIDPVLDPLHRAALVAMQAVGISTCTLGEVKERADLILCWGCDPASSHPRLFERFIEPPSRFLPQPRKILAISREPPTTKQTGERVKLANSNWQIEPDGELEILAALPRLCERCPCRGMPREGCRCRTCGPWPNNCRLLPIRW